MFVRKSAFTLIELMVVVAVIAILAAIALPMYTIYVNRAKINKAFNLVATFRDALILEYEKNGAWPTSINFAGITLNAGGYVKLDKDGLYYLYYNRWSATNNMRIMMNITGLKNISATISGTPYDYVDPNTGAAGEYNLAGIRMSVYDKNGLFITNCGQYSPSFIIKDLPLDYMPTSCQCNDVMGVVQDTPSASNANCVYK